MATKVQAQKFDKTNKAQIRVKGPTTRTGASTARNRFHNHGNIHKQR